MKYDLSEIALRPGEPYFVLRGQDVLAPHAITGYAALLRAAAAGRLGTNAEQAADLRRQADECDRIAALMIAWQAATDTAKLPD